MTDAEYHRNIRRIRRAHWLHYPIQALLLTTAALAGSSQVAIPTAVNPRFATWPALLLLLALLPLVSLVLYAVSRYMRPNLRRPYAENMRIYQSRIVLRNSLLGLLGLPLLAAYLITHQVVDLITYAGLLLLLSWQTAPSATTYQRWLLS